MTELTLDHVLRGRIRLEARDGVGDGDGDGDGPGASTGDGVLGLTVHAIDSDHQFDDDLGRTRTVDDGSFALAFDPARLADHESDEGEPEIYLRVLDRDGAVVHVDDAARSLPVEDAEIVLDEESLESHLSRPLRWSVPSGPPVPEEWADVIASAIDAVLAPRGTARHATLLETARCPGPPIFDGEGAIDTAGGALRGKPAETTQFRSLLDAVVETRGIDPDEAFFSEEWRQRVGTTMAARAATFRHLATEDPSLTAGPIETDVPIATCTDVDLTNPAGRPADTDELSAALAEASPAMADRLGSVRAELRERPPAIDPQVGRTFLGGAMSAADDPDRRRQYVAAIFDVLGSLTVYRDTYVVARRVLHGSAGPTALRAAIRRGAPDCGPVDGPGGDDGFGPDRPGEDGITDWEPPWEDFPGDIPGWDDEEDLIDEHWWGFCQTLPPMLFDKGKPYTITGLSPPSACGGDTLTIHGRNFGPRPGTVVFETQSGERRVTPTSWTDTKITVTVPAGATAGTIHLDITRGTSEICDRMVVEEAPPSASSITSWTGGKPNVSVYSPATIGQDCVEPGESIDIHWSFDPSSLTGVTLSMDQVGSKSVTAQSGTWTVTVPNSISSPTSLTMRIEATNACGTSVDEETIQVDVRPTLSIDDVEITQGIQTFTVGAGGPDNGLNTIEDKDTIVRVYVSADRKGFNSDEVPDVTGSLTVGGRTLQPINGSSPTGPPTSDPSITAVANPTRVETDHSLNFRIPAALASGRQTLDIYVQGPEICGSRETATDRFPWDWTGEPAVPVRYVRVRHTRGTTTQPSRADARFTVQRAFDLLPSPPTDIGPAPDDTMTSNANLGTDAGVQGLLGALETHRMQAVFAEWARRRRSVVDFALLNELLSHHYVALTQPFNRGWANNPGNTAVSCVYQNTHGPSIGTATSNDDWRRVKTAHELGHNLDHDHVNQGCGGGGPNCGGSCYNHPNGGQLTEIAFDPHWNTTLRDDPNSTGQEFDFMSYGCTRWTSSDSWGRLQNRI